jgi:hypothetical protein
MFREQRNAWRFIRTETSMEIILNGSPQTPGSCGSFVGWMRGKDYTK